MFNQKIYDYEHNVISCCKWCNWIKKDCSQMEFVKHCKKIVDNCIEILG